MEGGLKMSAIRQEKEAAVAEIKEKIERSNLTIFAEYRGLNVAKITDLRRKLRSVNSEAKVCKNTFSRMALNSLNIKYPEEVLVGTTLVITSTGEAADSAKTLVQFAKEHDVVKIKGGIFEQQSIPEYAVKEIATLPSRDELIAKAVGSIKAPLTGLVMSLSSPLRGLVLVLNSINEKKSGGDQ
jgi:large subunit ribosomal protein L10